MDNGLCEWGIGNTNGNTNVIHEMKNANKNTKIRYPVHTLRTAEEVWKEFNKNRESLDMSWNQYIKHLNKKYERWIEK